MQVPVESNITETPGNIPSVRLTSTMSPDEAAAPARSTEAAGQAMEQAGTQASRIATDMADVANQVRVSDSLNQLRQQHDDLLYNSDTGALNQRGANALNRPDGQSLADEYTSKLRENVSDIGSQLSNPMQKRMFAMQANGVLASFHGTVEQHMLQEFVKHSSDVNNTTIQQNVEAAARSNGNPDILDGAVKGWPMYGDDGKPLMDGNGNPVRNGGIAQAVDNQARLEGWSKDQRDMEITRQASNVYSSAIRMAINSGDPDTATTLFGRYSGNLTDKDAMELAPQMTQIRDSRLAMESANVASAQYSSAFQPDPNNRLVNIVRGMESGGKDYDKNGNPVTSSQGAQYAMQVMPDTAHNPGHGIAPAASETPEEYNRVGAQLLGALVKKYGDVKLGLAAYNAGEGRVDSAIADAKTNASLLPQYNDAVQKAAQAAAQAPTPENQKALADATTARDAVVNGTNWLSLLPKETQDYATKGEQQYVAGQGRPPFPTKLEFVNAGILHLNTVMQGNPTPQQIQMTRSRLEQQYELFSANVKEQGDQAWTIAQRSLIAANGDESAVPPQVMNDLLQKAPDKLDNFHAFAKALTDGKNDTDFASYNWAISHPDQLAKMSDADFQYFQTTKMGGRDRESMARLRQDAIDGKTNSSPQSLDTGSINTLVNNRLGSLGIKTGAQGDQQQLGATRRFINDQVLQNQQATGQKMHYADLEKFIDGIFSKNLTFKNSYLGGFVTTTSTKPMMGMSASDIPDDQHQAIVKQFQARGINNPSDQDVLRMYWHAHSPQVSRQ